MALVQTVQHQEKNQKVLIKRGKLLKQQIAKAALPHLGKSKFRVLTRQKRNVNQVNVVFAFGFLKEKPTAKLKKNKNHESKPESKLSHL